MTITKISFEIFILILLSNHSNYEMITGFGKGIRGYLPALQTLELNNDEQIDLALFDVRSIRFVSDNKLTE